MPIPGTGGTGGHREAMPSRSPGTMLTAALESQPAAGAEVGLAGALHGIAAWVPQPPSTGMNVTSITRRCAEQAGRLGDPDNTALLSRIPHTKASAEPSAYRRGSQISRNLERIPEPCGR